MDRIRPIIANGGRDDDHVGRSLTGGKCGGGGVFHAGCVRVRYWCSAFSRNLGSHAKGLRMNCDRCDVFSNILAREFGWPNSLLSGNKNVIIRESRSNNNEFNDKG